MKNNINARVVCRTLYQPRAAWSVDRFFADDKAPAALTGQVISEAEGAMEGVVARAHKDGSIVSVSVTTDARGRYAFPENKLVPGEYKITIRAVLNPNRLGAFPTVQGSRLQSKGYVRRNACRAGQWLY